MRLKRAQFAETLEQTPRFRVDWNLTQEIDHCSKSICLAFDTRSQVLGHIGRRSVICKVFLGF